MFILPGEHIQVARMFTLLLQGEHVACECAQQQARLFPDLVSQRFFANQARQETLHAQIFQCGIGLLAPKGIAQSSNNQIMQDYGRLIESALACNDLAESLLGLQIVLEGWGEVVLKRFSTGCSARGFGFHHIRKILLGQEEAHHTFGVRRLSAFSDDNHELIAVLRVRSEDYLALIAKIMASTHALFEYFDEDPAEYLTALNATLPDWLLSRGNRVGI